VFPALGELALLQMQFQSRLGKAPLT
jgi:hypothetical protein